MKKRIGTIYNKPIIEGDINLKTPNEIHKNELKGGENSGSSVSKYAPRYFKIDWNKASKNMYEIFTGRYSNNYWQYETIIVSSVKFNLEGDIYVIFNNQNLSSIINTQPDAEKNIIAFSYLPLHNVMDSVEDVSQMRIMSFEEQINSGKNYGLSMDGITEITEDEYYKID